jgi:hypothetical protein
MRDICAPRQRGRVADQVCDAGLDLGLRIDGFNGLGEATQDVDVNGGEQDVLIGRPFQQAAADEVAAGHVPVDGSKNKAAALERMRTLGACD